MNIHVREVIFSNGTRVTYIKSFIRIFVKLCFWTIFIKFMKKNAVFCHLVKQELKVANETSIFGQCSCYTYIDKSNYPEETELDTNPSLTLAQTLTLSIVSTILAILLPVVVTTARFLILRTWIHHTIWRGIQSLDQISISDENSQLHEIDS